MDSFGAAEDRRPWLCTALHAGVVDMPFHTDGLEGTGDVG